METTAAEAPAGAEKRKLAVLGFHSAEKPVEAAAEELDPEPIAKKTRSSAEEDGVDRISDLPDDILGDIVSLLPTKDAARTQSLSTRWRHIWRYSPLNLDCTDLRLAGGDPTGVVSRILSAHGGPCRRLRIPPYYLLDHPAVTHAWLRSPAMNNLEELDLCYTRSRSQSHILLRRQPAFRFLSTLRSATITTCHLPDNAIVHLPQLRQLALEHVLISEDSLHSMIAGCPVLECLLLSLNWGFRSLRINSPTLTSIGFHSEYVRESCFLGKIIIEDAPCLERLLCLEPNYAVSVSVISAPKLQTLGCLFDHHTKATISFGSTVIQGVRVDNLATMVRSVKILAVSMYSLRLDTVIDLMGCFPCLEKLYVKLKFTEAGWENTWRHKYRNLVKTLDLRLKKIVLEIFEGIWSHVNFVNFFILNAGVLELMQLKVAPKNYNDAFFARQNKMLQLEKRASRGARLEFTTDQCHEKMSHIKHVRDMDLIDPFECRC